MKYWIILLLSLSCFEACKTQRSSPQLTLPNLAGSTIIEARVLKILDERSAAYPCSEVSCIALVKIEKVKKRAGNFTRPIDRDQEGEMRFEFTLSKTTKTLFPNLEKQFPGLKEGERFRANIKEEQLLGISKTRWVAYDYILLN